MSKHTMSDLYQMQSLSLSAKIRMTQERIRAWYDHWDGMVYASFSGGKDSTVLVDIITNMGLDDIPLVFVDTGLEYPEIREFVKSFGDRVTWLKPKMNFKRVCKTYGFPFISKEVAEAVYGAKKYLHILFEQMNNSQTDRQTDGGIPIGTSMRNSQELACILNKRLRNREGGQNYRLAILLGMLDKNNQIRANLPKKDRSMYSCEKYNFFLECPFEISSKCCNVMKKAPVHKYAKETGRKPITAQMASESRLRTQQWIKNGCNGFEMKSPISNPMSFWTEQDVLLYVKQNNLPIAPVYGDVVCDDESQIDGQMNIGDYINLEEFELERPLLKTTGCKRTGCVFCGFGCHMKGDTRFVDLKRTHPKLYEYIMKPEESGGLGYKEKIDWINKNGNLNIRY